jgi:hypothetical protein
MKMREKPDFNEVLFIDYLRTTPAYPLCKSLGGPAQFPGEEAFFLTGKLSVRSAREV